MTNQPERIFFSGDSLEQAVMAAARHYDCDPDVLLYERVEKRHGFLRAPRRVVIRVDPERYRRAAGERQPSPEDQLAAMDRRPLGQQGPAAAERFEPGGDARRRSSSRGSGEERTSGRERRPRREADVPIPPPSPAPASSVMPPAQERFAPAEGPEADAAREGLETLFELAGLELEADVLQGDGRLEIDVGGVDREELHRGEGQLLRAFQHLLPRMVKAGAGELVPCRVDSSNYQRQREEQLRGLAQRLAEEVRADGQPKTLRPLSPADRRIIHLALADDPEIVTESQGGGYYKRVTLRVS